jgi:hypothetical protein
MFTRFRQTRHRRQVSLVETRRLNGKVHHEHVASLGSVETPPSVPERIAFWLKLHDRLGKLSNRIDAATHGKVLGAVHARIAMVTADEQRALQLENAEADAQFWSNFRDMNAETVEDHKGLVAQAERKIADGQSATANAAANADIAKKRILRRRSLISVIPIVVPAAARFIITASHRRPSSARIEASRSTWTI